MSITRSTGTSKKRSHIFSLAAGPGEKDNSKNGCPCHGKATSKPPIFVGNDYYCESASAGHPSSTAILGGDPLWDGLKLQYDEAKCKKSLMPWFKHSISPATRDELELRLCRSKGTHNVYLGNFEIYIH